MFGLFKNKNGDNKERQAAKKSTDNFNSLVEDQHVDPDNAKHMKVFDQVRAELNKLGFKSMRIRGLRVENVIENALTLAKVEVLCYTEDGIVEFHQLANHLKDKVMFSYVRLMGDNIDNTFATDKTKVGEKGFTSMMEGFTVGNFSMTYEYRFYNFDPEPTPLLAFVDSLVGNPSLQTIGFARNGLNQDLAAAIIQRVYYNPSLSCIDINGNNISTAEFVDQIVKPYFRSREGFRIIVD